MKFNYEKMAIENLSTRNCHGYLGAAENTASNELLRAAQCKMFHSFAKFRRTNAFKRLAKEDLVVYLSSRNLNYKSTKEV
jgi:BTB And C-terminal Kelch